MASIRVRFAPSPTGHVHIGNIRTAIFNWLFARHEGAVFLLRIEDTDRERSTPEAIRTLLECMDWLGLTYDEEIVYQSSMIDNHNLAAKKLLEEKKAWREENNPQSPIIFNLPWDTDSLPFIRKAGDAQISVSSEVPVEISRNGISFAVPGAKGAYTSQSATLAGFHGLKIFDTQGQCVFQIENEIGRILHENAKFHFLNVSRLEFERREIFYEDIIKGTLAKPLDSMKDFVIVRGDGTPVFHLANVCDDISQKITHIIRGDDHVENTYRHIFLFHALGAVPPKYAHLPMIVNKQGKPFSKRDGDAYVGDYRAKGFLPQALFNYLALLGWSPGDDREKMTLDELIKAFSLDRVKSSPAQFDMNKLINMNSLYIAEMDSAKFADEAHKQIESSGNWILSEKDKDLFVKVAALLQSRTKTMTDVLQWKYFFSDEFEKDEKAFDKFVRKPEVTNAFRVLSNKLANLETANFTAIKIENLIRETEKECGIQEGKLNQPLRIALTGIATGAGIYETIELLGKDKTIRRLL